MSSLRLLTHVGFYDNFFPRSSMKKLETFDQPKNKRVAQLLIFLLILTENTLTLETEFVEVQYKLTDIDHFQK